MTGTAEAAAALLVTSALTLSLILERRRLTNTNTNRKLSSDLSITPCHPKQGWHSDLVDKSRIPYLLRKTTESTLYV